MRKRHDLPSGCKELPYGTLQISLQPFVRERLLVLKFESNSKEQEIAITEADVLHCETFVTCMQLIAHDCTFAILRTFIAEYFATIRAEPRKQRLTWPKRRLCSLVAILDL
eukprot:s945_g12.t1